MTKKSDYFLDGIPNEEYHADKDIMSSSMLKEFAFDPASMIWSKNAEQDKSKLDTIDFGTDFHLYFLEPDEFKKTRRVLPVFNRRKPAEKEEELEMIADWKARGIKAVKSEDMDKLEAMRCSALSHPTIYSIMSLSGVAERSYYWIDDETGVECRCRPDLLIEDFTGKQKPPFMSADEEILVLDIKTAARMDRIQAQIEDLKYWMQDAFYTRGIQQVAGKKACFVFGFVSTSLSLGRYPVQVVKLAEGAKFDGKRAVSDALIEYAELRNSAEERHWQTVVEIDRPHWATNSKDVFS